MEWINADFAKPVSKGRLRVFSEKDAGMYDAINRGLEKAGGEICAYLNCDEQYLPGTLAKVVDFFSRHPEIDVLFGDVILVFPSGEPISYRRSILPDQEHLRSAHLNTFTCATFFRRTLVDEGLVFDPNWKAAGDAAWMDKLLTHKVRMAVLPRPTSVFTFTGKNLGDSAVSRAESARFKGRNPSGASLLRSWLTVSWHRLRKLQAGAYWPRRVAIDVYTHESPEKRKHFKRRWIGFSWPKGGKRNLAGP